MGERMDGREREEGGRERGCSLSVSALKYKINEGCDQYWIHAWYIVDIS